MKRDKPLARKAPSRSRSSGMKRGGTVRKRNPKRRASAFALAYHSRARVAFVRSLLCACGCGRTPSDNAHTGRKPGKGLKSGYETVVPLFRECHRAHDERRPPFDDPQYREHIAAFAPRVEAMWQAHANQQGIAA